MEKEVFIKEINNLIIEGDEVLKTKWNHTEIIDFNTYVERYIYVMEIKNFVNLKKEYKR